MISHYTYMDVYMYEFLEKKKKKKKKLEGIFFGKYFTYETNIGKCFPRYFLEMQPNTIKYISDYGKTNV
jgi:hypothetical protein